MSTPAIGLMPPHDLDAESSVLSSCFLEQHGRALDQARSMLKVSDFYSDANRYIFQAMCELQDEGKPFDVVTVSSRLRANNHWKIVGGSQYLSIIIDATPYYYHVLDYARIVKDKWRLRRLLELVRTVPGMLTEIDKEGAVQNLFDTLQERLADLSQLDAPKYLKPLREVLADVNALVAAAKNKDARVIGVATGFDVDKLTGGLHDSDLRIVAGRPGAGKTAFALSEALNISQTGIATAIFSLEMSGVQLGLRLASMESQLTVGHMRSGELSADQFKRFTEAAQRLAPVPLFIDDTPMLTVYEVKARLKRLKSEIANDRYEDVTQKRLGAGYIDYLQLMKPSRPSNSRENDVSSISRELKESAKQLSIPITAMAQLNREVEKGADKRPQLHHLRESGSIEADADDILFLYRPEYYARDQKAVPEDQKGLAEVIVAKQRNGATGTINLTFVAKNMRFMNRAPDDASAPYVHHQDDDLFEDYDR
ncbi:MAG TPA: replicative DNA helicase [Pirellulales bacterium]|nr:replicative DNA helicase [Pirellulales bacterium]